MLEEFKSLSKENNKLEEKPDANNTPASLEEAQSNALMALADTAASLSRAVNKIAAYVPTQWVDNSEPSINANNLMHIENGIRDATAAVNNAIDAITEINGKIGNIQNSGIVNDMDNAISNRIEFMGYDRNTLNSPQKQGISGSGDGVALSYDSGLYGVQFGIARADSYPLIRIRENGSWKPWKNIALKSDLTERFNNLQKNILYNRDDIVAMQIDGYRLQLHKNGSISLWHNDGNGWKHVRDL